MSRTNWLKRWNLKSDPCKDIEINNPENFKFLVPTKTINAIDAEVQDIKNSQIGAIKPVIGSRGSGKTTSLYYLIHKLQTYEDILPAYINMYKSLSLIQESPYPITHIARFVIKELILGIIQSCITLSRDFVIKKPSIENIIQRAKQKQLAPDQIPSVTDEDLEILIDILDGEGFTTVLAIDELDKFETSEQIKNLAGFFRNKQSLFTKLASKYRTFFYISSSNRWNFLKDKDFSYLSSTFVVSRINFLEARRILERRFEIFSPGSKPPFTDPALRSLVSIFNGNPRMVIFAAGRLLRVAHEKDVNIIDDKLVREVYGEESIKRFRDDYEEIILTDKKAGYGALIIWHLCTLAPPDQRKEALDYLTLIYTGDVKERNESLIGILEASGCIKSYPKDGSMQIHQAIVSFYNKWKELGHTPSEFNEWYSTHLQEPPGIPYSYNLIQGLCKRIKEYDAMKNLMDSWNTYFNLEISTEPLEILYLSWKMLENEIKAFCIEYGTYKLKLTKTTLEDVATEKALEFLGIRDHQTRELLMKLNIALRLARIDFESFGIVASVYQKTCNGSGIKEANLIKEQAKLAYNELLKKWLDYSTRRKLFRSK